MAEPLFSPSWYRVSQLKPRLRGHTRIYRHEYRGEVWYVLQDHAKGRYYRFTPVAYHVIGLMNGRRTVQDLWERASDRFGDDGPTQSEVVQLLSHLHGSDVLLCNVPPDTAELLRRAEKIEKAQWWQRFRSPLAVKIPLLDPETFLARTAWLMRPLFGVFGALVWLGVVATAVVLAGLHWPELTEDIIDRVLSTQNLLAIWFIYPIVKTLHEFGHAYAVKTWGGEVHEMGIMFLVLMPIPYVDASAASEFRARYRRVLVGAMGILVELFVASLALFVWVGIEPGTMRSFAYNVVLIGGVSTIFFNANPLLRFDGYYILSDLLNIPNMAQRGMKYMGYLVKRHLFRIGHVEPPYTGPGEPFWFVTFTIASFIYRMFIYVGIVFFVAGKFFFIGVLLAMWAAVNMVVVPISKGLNFVLSSPLLRENRPRAVLLSGAGLAALFILLFVLPVPLRTCAEGVIWVPDEALVRAGTPGFVDRVAVDPGARVEPGQVLVECRDPLLSSRANVLRARLAELQSRYDAARTVDQVQVGIIREEIRDVRTELDRAEERLAELEVRSPTAGRFVVPRAADLPGHYLNQGDPIGFVLEIERPTVRVVVPQSRIDLVRQRSEGVAVRLAERLSEILPAVIRREVPEAEEKLPSTVLGSVGGGQVAIDPFEASGTRTFEKLFQFDLELVEPVEPVFIGGRVYVRFDHGTEPIAFRIYRKARQMFLRRLNV